MSGTAILSKDILTRVTLDIPYKEWKFLLPPRPETVISSSTIGFYEQRGWLAQYKKNGTCSLIGVSPEGVIHNLNRHGEAHKRWIPGAATRRLVEFAPKGVWTVFLGELMHEKTILIKDTLYIFDIIVAESKQLIGTTFLERQGYLTSLFPKPIGDTDSHYVMTAKIWLAKPIMRNMSETFEAIRDAKDTSNEGLVLKDPQGKLDLMRTGANQGWQVKVRIPVPNSHRGM